MAQLGFRTMEEMIGHVEALDVQPAVDHWKASGLDISPILQIVDNPYDQAFHLHRSSRITGSTRRSTRS